MSQLNHHPQEYLTPGRKDDAGKVRLSLLPWAALTLVAQVLEFGAKKYAVNNWKAVENGEERYFEAALRHLAAQAEGEDRDPESNLPHAAHAACDLLMHLWFRVKRERA